MQATQPLSVGQPVPEFTLKGPGGQPVSLADYRGRKNVVLVFYPLAFSPVCSHQLPELEKSIGRFEALDTALLGVSVDSHYANEAFARHLGLSFPLLSDFDHQVSLAYGVFNPEKGYSRRALFAVDKQGRLLHREVSAVAGDVKQIPDPDQALAALRASQ
jgi:peroxiredoxin